MVERQIGRLIGVAARAVTLPRGRVRLIGPPGSGKTTSVIRLAANHVLHYGVEQIAIIGQDVNRLAGCEQLQLASELLRVPVYEAADERSLRAAIAETAGKALVIIDTPGIVATHRLPETIGDLAGFETFLVLPATFKSATLDAARASWRGHWCRPACCSVTSMRSIRSARCCRSAVANSCRSAGWERVAKWRTASKAPARICWSTTQRVRYRYSPNRPTRTRNRQPRNTRHPRKRAAAKSLRLEPFFQHIRESDESQHEPGTGRRSDRRQRRRRQNERFGESGRCAVQTRPACDACSMPILALRTWTCCWA